MGYQTPNPVDWRWIQVVIHRRGAMDAFGWGCWQAEARKGDWHPNWRSTGDWSNDVVSNDVVSKDVVSKDVGAKMGLGLVLAHQRVSASTCRCINEETTNE